MCIRLIFFSLSLLSLPIFAQQTEFGIGLSVGHSALAADQLQNEPNFAAISPNGDWGFGLSIYGAHPIKGRLFVSTVPGIFFQDQLVAFALVNAPGATQVEEVLNASLVLPLRVEFRSLSGNWSPVAAIGVGALLDLTAGRNGLLETNELSTFWEVAVGLEKATQHFKFRPEIFTRRGFGQVANGTNDNIYNQALGDMSWGYIGFRLLFYGSRGRNKRLASN
ncbi:MAG: hypothetical protein AAFQ37_15295, partial [Bacteroidota bacterium]